MNFSDLANIGSLINGLAVLVSLLYLSAQVRHARRIQQAAMHQSRVERVTNVSLRYAEPDCAKVLAKAASGASDFSAMEVLQLFFVVRIQVLALDDAFWQAEAGFLDEPSLQTTILTMKRMMSNPVLRAAWRLVSPQIAPAFRERVEQLVRETPLAPPADWSTAWQEEYVKVGLKPL